MAISSAQAAAQYKKVQSAYTPKQEIQKDNKGLADLAFYEELSKGLAEAISQPSDGGKEAIGASSLLEEQPPERIEKMVNPVYMETVEKRKEEVLPLAKIYVASLGLSDESEEGQLQIQKTVDFYSRNEQVFERFKQLVSSLSG